MSAGATKEYKFNTKNNWRRWNWNRIGDFFTVHERKSKTILYLAGESNLDAEIAAEKGFNPKRMIAIERDKHVTRALRDNGVTTINGDFFDVIRNWDDYADVVIGDFCCGLSDTAIGRIGDLAFNPNISKAVLSFNFLRGRDASTNEVRAELNEWVKTETKHRGELFMSAFGRCVAWALEGEIVVQTTAGLEDKRNIGHHIGNIVDRSGDVIINDLMRPKSFSYKSGALSFDSVVFRNPFLMVCGWEPPKSAISRNIVAARAVMARRVTQATP